MTFRKIRSRFAAAMLSAVMSATVLASPVTCQMAIVTAAGSSYTLEATESEDDDAPNRARFPVSKEAKEVTFTFETTSKDAISFGVFGLEINEAPWWADVKQDYKVTPKDGKGSFTYTIPSEYAGKVKKVCVGLWYPHEGVSVNMSASEGGSPTNPDNPDKPGPVGPQEKPVSANAKSGAWNFKDNKDGTATISTTLTAELEVEDEKGNKTTQFDYLLTKGYDEESYVVDGTNTFKPGDPINSHKFKFSEFGLEDLSEITIQSFNYTVTADEDMEKFMYGGGINVDPQSPADTEFLKGKPGYWYNDQGDEDMEKYGDQFQIKVNNGWVVENAGNYMEVVWDVPEEVQPYVSKNPTDTVGFQFWYAPAANLPEGEDYAEVETCHLKSASCTYTRSVTVPYNNTVNKKVGQKLTPGGDEKTNQYKYFLKDLGLENRDLVSAIKFNVTSSADLKKFTGGVGISVGNENTIAKDGWFMPKANITILEPEKNKFEIMWIVPEGIRKDVDVISEDGNLMFGAWYTGAKEGDASPDITLDSVDIYEFLSNEDDLVVEPENFELEVGETKKLDINVKDCTFTVTNSKVVSVDKDGNVTALTGGQTPILVKTPEGQEKTIIVKVNAAPDPTEPKPTEPDPTEPKPTEPTPTEPIDPNEVIDWTKVKYGDVNLDGSVNIADAVALSKYLIDPKANYINATARENGNCQYDESLDSLDSTLIVNYSAMIIEEDELGAGSPHKK